jgi:hypothetical protein
MGFIPDFKIARDLEKVRALVARISHPFWMHRPEAWIWARPDGKPQGFASLMADQPGLCNLLWLATDLDVPPPEYDAMSNSLYMMLSTERVARLAGYWLNDAAGLMSLRDFAAALDVELTRPPVSAVERAYPLLRLLARGRLGHAHP